MVGAPSPLFRKESPRLFRHPRGTKPAILTRTWLCIGSCRGSWVGAKSWQRFGSLGAPGGLEGGLLSTAASLSSKSDVLSARSFES